MREEFEVVEDDHDLQLHSPEKFFTCDTIGCHGSRTLCTHGYINVSCGCGVSNDMCEKCLDEWWEERRKELRS